MLEATLQHWTVCAFLGILSIFGLSRPRLGYVIRRTDPPTQRVTLGEQHDVALWQYYALAYVPVYESLNACSGRTPVFAPVSENNSSMPARTTSITTSPLISFVLLT